MRIPATFLFVIAGATGAWAADMPRSFQPFGIQESEDIVVRPMRRIVTKRYVCVRCSRLPLGGLREPIVAHVPLGGLGRSCPPAVIEAVRERVVLRVKG